MDGCAGAVFEDTAEVRWGEEKLTGELFKGQIFGNVTVNVGKDRADQSRLIQVHAQCRDIQVGLVLQAMILMSAVYIHHQFRKYALGDDILAKSAVAGQLVDEMHQSLLFLRRKLQPMAPLFVLVGEAGAKIRLFGAKAL